MNEVNKQAGQHLCVACAYFVPNMQARSTDLKSNVGNCQRHPPVTGYHQQGNRVVAATAFPMVNELVWCGDHSDIELARRHLGGEP